ncbi:MAG: peptidase U32 family protein [Thermodesulfobacteriota bacterium]
MEFVVHIQDQESLAMVLEQGAGAVAVRLPRNPEAGAWSELSDWRGAAGQRGLKFYVIWDELISERELPGVAAVLAGVSRLNPDGFKVRDLGLVREARRLYPHLPLVASGNWGAYNSPGVRLAESLGFSRVVLDGPVSLKDLALIRRQTAVPLEVTLPPFCQGYAGLCLLDECLGLSCEACCLFQEKSVTSRSLMEALEIFSALCQLGVEAVQIPGELFAPASLAQVLRLFQSIVEASPVERPRVLAAVKDLLGVFGEGLVRSQLHEATLSGYRKPVESPSRRSASRPEFPGLSRIWLEARDYAEVLALSREWREPLVISLTPDNYAAFLKEHRRWGPRKLIWRLPPAIRESSLAFYQKALETLSQGGYSRFVAGDWGAVALVRGVSGQVYGDQTLGVRNSWAVAAARELQVARVCLPPGPRPERWLELLKAAPASSFWGYLYQITPLALCQGEVPSLLPQKDLRWVPENGRAILTLKNPLDWRDRGKWFKQQGIFPLVVALPHSPMPRGQLPVWLKPRPRTAPTGK